MCGEYIVYLYLFGQRNSLIQKWFNRVTRLLRIWYKRETDIQKVSIGENEALYKVALDYHNFNSS